MDSTVRDSPAQLVWHMGDCGSVSGEPTAIYGIVYPAFEPSKDSPQPSGLLMGSRNDGMGIAQFMGAWLADRRHMLTQLLRVMSFLSEFLSCHFLAFRPIRVQIGFHFGNDGYSVKISFSWIFQRGEPIYCSVNAVHFVKFPFQHGMLLCIYEKLRNGNHEAPLEQFG